MEIMEENDEIILDLERQLIATIIEKKDVKLFEELYKGKIEVSKKIRAIINSIVFYYKKNKNIPTFEQLYTMLITQFKDSPEIIENMGNEMLACEIVGPTKNYLTVVDLITNLKIKRKKGELYAG